LQQHQRRMREQHLQEYGSGMHIDKMQPATCMWSD
jgi:hypothetical protein